MVRILPHYQKSSEPNSHLQQYCLTPAFDVTYAYNPTGAWTSEHQMRLNHKQDNFTQEDLITYAKIAVVDPKNTKHIEHTFRKQLMV